VLQRQRKRKELDDDDEASNKRNEKMHRCKDGHSLTGEAKRDNRDKDGKGKG